MAFVCPSWTVLSRTAAIEARIFPPNSPWYSMLPAALHLFISSADGPCTGNGSLQIRSLPRRYVRQIQSVFCGRNML